MRDPGPPFLVTVAVKVVPRFAIHGSVPTGEKLTKSRGNPQVVNPPWKFACECDDFLGLTCHDGVRGYMNEAGNETCLGKVLANWLYHD